MNSKKRENEKHFSWYWSRKMWIKIEKWNQFRNSNGTGRAPFILNTKYRTSKNKLRLEQMYSKLHSPNECKTALSVDCFLCFEFTGFHYNFNAYESNCNGKSFQNGFWMKRIAMFGSCAQCYTWISRLFSVLLVRHQQIVKTRTRADSMRLVLVVVIVIIVCKMACMCYSIYACSGTNKRFIDLKGFNRKRKITSKDERRRLQNICRHIWCGSFVFQFGVNFTYLPPFNGTFL